VGATELLVLFPTWLLLDLLGVVLLSTLGCEQRYVVARTNFNVLNSHCYSMYLNLCKFEFSKDPRQFYNFVNAKRKSSALPSSVRLNSIEASTEITDLFAEFFQSTYSFVSWSNSSYPNHLNRANCIFIPVTRRVKGYTRFVGKYVTGRGSIPVTRRVKGYTRFVGKYVTGRRKA